MKPKLFFLLIICCFLTGFNIPGKTYKRQDPRVLSSRAAILAKEECKTIVKSYYFDLKTITGENIDSAADQNILIDGIQQDCFRGPEVVINNNIPEISQDNLDVKNYLKSISVLSDRIEKIGFNENMTLSDIYYNSTDHYYYLVAYIDQSIAIKNASNANKKVDFYINFDPENNLRPKIYSIQNHKDGVLNNQNLVRIVSEDQAEKTTDANKPYFVFDITPNNADIEIDGKSQFYNGSKIETTPGDHIIELQASNYQNLKFDAVASDTGVQHIVRDLTLKHGYLFVNSADNSLQEPEVYIDSNMVGAIPLTNYKLDVGSHFVEVKGGNNFYKSYNVTITDENITTLNIRGALKAKWEEKRNVEDAPAPADVSFQAFYDQLSPYGQWVDDPQYGNIFVPDVSGDFRPYFTDGHWVMTDYGNTWVSDDPWGWACYHYGRWTYDPYYGWVWVPGYEWAPAWVTWRFGDQACGWAPLSPGLSVGVSNGCPNSWWIFIGPDRLYGSGYAAYRKGPENNVVYIRQTTIINNIHPDNSTHVRYNYGPSSAVVEHVTHTPVVTYRVSTQTTVPRGSVVNGETVTIYRANLASTSPYTAHPRSVLPVYRSIQRPQEISAINRQSDFRRDVQTNKLQPRQFNRPAEQIQRPDNIGQPRQQQQAAQQAQQRQQIEQQQAQQRQQVEQQRAAQQPQAEQQQIQQRQQQQAAQQAQQQRQQAGQQQTEQQAQQQRQQAGQQQTEQQAQQQRQQVAQQQAAQQSQQQSQQVVQQQGAQQAQQQPRRCRNAKRGQQQQVVQQPGQSQQQRTNQPAQQPRQTQPKKVVVKTIPKQKIPQKIGLKKL